MKKLAQIGLVAVLTTSILGGCGNNNLTRDLDNNTQPRNTTYDDRNTAFNERGGFFGNRNTALNERDGFFGNRNTTVNDRNGIFNDRSRVDNTGVRNVGTQSNDAGSGEVQRVKQGYLTIDQNSFSTTIPSEKFPHSQKIEQRGPYAIYKFQQGQPKGEQPRANQAQPEAAPQPKQAPPTQNQAGEQPSANENKQQAAEPGNTEGISQTEQKVIELTNAERRKNGLSDLKADAPLSNVAREKSKDMKAKNYFSHQSPTYGSPFDMMRDFGISYNTAGENIAMGQRSPEEVVQAWMNSEGHRKNILNGNFTHIGVGYVQDGNYWTQMFIGK
ncbi:CAP domain-containing protein [Sutcliffiella halmapala]|uniref:CAP domain-containing protein n=1 Tax=Sutcliffiella halmapala TaxID=79882 RepID=UPI0009955466|nr:CAP domain-containing protein [Sutcliffiella halmapala]